MITTPRYRAPREPPLSPQTYVSRNPRRTFHVLGGVPRASLPALGRRRSMRKVAERALEHDDEEVRRLANQLLAELERSSALRRRQQARSISGIMRSGVFGG